MYNFCLYKRRLDRNTVLGLWLFASWYAGLFLGFIAADFHGGTVVSFLRQAPLERSSVFAVLCASAFPLLFSACAVTFIHSGICYLIALTYGFCLALLAGALVVCYGSGGFLLTVLLLFSAVFGSCVLLWYLLRRLQSQQGFVTDTVLGLLVIFTLGMIDYFIVSPFLTDIFKL